MTIQEFIQFYKNTVFALEALTPSIENLTRKSSGRKTAERIAPELTRLNEALEVIKRQIHYVAKPPYKWNGKNKTLYFVDNDENAFAGHTVSELANLTPYGFYAIVVDKELEFVAGKILRFMQYEEIYYELQSFIRLGCKASKFTKEGSELIIKRSCDQTSWGRLVPSLQNFLKTEPSLADAKGVIIVDDDKMAIVSNRNLPKLRIIKTSRPFDIDRQKKRLKP